MLGILYTGILLMITKTVHIAWNYFYYLSGVCVMSLVYFILCSVILKGGRDKEEDIFYLVLSMDEIVACER